MGRSDGGIRFPPRFPDGGYEWFCLVVIVLIVGMLIAAGIALAVTG